MFRRFGQLFGKKLQNVAHFVKKHEKSSVWPKLATFRANYHVSAFGQLFGKKLQNLAHFVKKLEKSSVWQLFERTTMFRHFGQLFGKKLQNVAHFVKKHEKSSVWPKLASFGAKYYVSASWSTFQQKMAHFVAHFAKKEENSSIWPKLVTFPAKYHVSAFWSTFRQKIEKSGSFREKARKIIDLAKTSSFSSELPCFGVLVNFSAKSFKKWVTS